MPNSKLNANGNGPLSAFVGPNPEAQWSTRQAKFELLVAAQEEFDAKVTFLNTAALGLPPRRSWEALENAIDDWKAGIADPASYDAPLTSARHSFAELVGVDAPLVAVGSQVSVFAGLIAASLPDNCEVLTAVGDFTSILFPFHVQEGRGIAVREVPLERIAESVTDRTALVSVSSVQSANGRLVDLEQLHAMCEITGTRIMLDTTQSTGWLPIDASRFAYTICGGYKWLLSPRGTAYFTIQPELIDDLVPHTAGWYSGEVPWSSIYGTPLRLARDARRFDVSPAWHAWVAAGPALGLLADIGNEMLYEHSLGLANCFREGIGLAPGDSAIVSVLADEGAGEAMRSAGIVASERAGRLRLSFHVSTTLHDVERAIEVLGSHILS